MSPSALKLLLADGVVVLLALGCASSSLYERRRTRVKRWRLLLPGLLAILATAILVSFPKLQDLRNAQLGVIAAVSLLVGIARGSFLPLFSDHNWGLIRMRRTIDGVVFALAFALFGAVQAAYDLRVGLAGRSEPIMELTMIIVSCFLLGRSVASWIRAGVIPHDDLFEPQA